MYRKIIATAVIGGSLLLGACAPYVRVSKNPPTAFMMRENGPVPPGCCDRGDQLDVLMKPDATWVQRCLDMGGRPIARGRQKTCQSVDS
jgi:hypothetical protein